MGPTYEEIELAWILQFDDWNREMLRRLVWFYIDGRVYACN